MDAESPWRVRRLGGRPNRVVETSERPEGAIWAPSGPVLDGAGNLYVATGNGSSTSSFDFGNAVVRITDQAFDPARRDVAGGLSGATASCR